MSLVDTEVNATDSSRNRENQQTAGKLALAGSRNKVTIGDPRTTKAALKAVAKVATTASKASTKQVAIAAPANDTNWLLYGGIAAAVLVAAFVVWKVSK